MKVNLGEAIGEIANDLVHREKFKRPIIMFAVAANGSVLAGEYPRGRLPVTIEYFCERPVGKMVELPLNIFYVDASGRTARAMMDAEGVQISIDERVTKKAARRKQLSRQTFAAAEKGSG